MVRKLSRTALSQGDCTTSSVSYLPLITIVDLILCPDLHVSMITIQSRSEKQILINHSHLFEL
jgi:hypothetical protein